jgi:hypothetical protein
MQDETHPCRTVIGLKDPADKDARLEDVYAMDMLLYEVCLVNLLVSAPVCCSQLRSFYLHTT